MDEAGGSAKRIRYWSELSQTDKIERMRSIMKLMQTEIKRLSKRVEHLEHHEHIDGSIFIKFDRIYLHDIMEDREGIKLSNDDVYF